MPIMTRLLLALALLCFANEARAEWRRAETPHFKMQGDLPEAEIRGLATELEAVDALMRSLTGTTDAPKARKADILIVGDVATVQRLTGIPGFVGGITIANPLGNMIIVAHEVNSNDPQYQFRSPLFHEYGHDFMLRHLGSNLPGWYVEGFATYFSSARVLPGGEVRFGAFPWELEGAFDQGPSVAFKDIMSVVAEREDGPPPLSLYAQGWLIAHHYLSHGARSAEIGRYLDAVRAGQSVARPETFFAGGIAGFDIEMASYFKALPQPREARLGVIDPASLVERALRPAETLLVDRRLRDLAIRSRGTAASDIEEMRQRLLASYRSAKAVLDQYPDEAELGFYVSALALACEERQQARAIADTLLAHDANNPLLLAFKADVLTEIAREEDPGHFSELIAESRSLIRRALTIDPDNAVAASALFRNYSADEGASPNARRYLARAIQLNPADFELRMRAVELSQRNGDLPAAIEMLEPIANSPHDSRDRAQAIATIAAMRRRLGQ